ncbi:MAG: hypothetical protein L0K86_28230 [Actinomycetia bacterium]|nr:hypothetical protein [Actinomycetes bacterium]
MLRRKKSKADEVKDKATEIQEKAAETIGPKVSDAREAAGSAFESVRDDIAPAIRDGVASAISTSDGKDSEAKADKPKKKRGGKLKKLVIITGIGGIVFFVTKKVKDSQNGPPVPPPAPRPTPAPSPATPPRPTNGDAPSA